MSVELKNIMKVSGIFVGSVIGAGFASGQEILQFFTVYRRNGIIGIILTIILFCFLSIAVMEYVYKFKMKNYTELINSLAGKYAGMAIEFIVMFFLGISFFIMTAGAGALFKEHFGLSVLIGAAIISISCCIVFLFNFKGVIAINTVIAPILVVCIGALGCWVLSCSHVPTFSIQSTNVLGNWFSSSIIYVSYNSIALIAMMSTLLPFLTSRKVVYAGSLLGGGLLLIMAIVIFAMTDLYYPEIMKFEIPIIHVVKKLNFSASGFYSVVLLIAMFVHAVTAGFCFLNKISCKSVYKFNLYAIIMCILAIPLSLFGFSNMVKGIYPLFGYIGLFQVIIISASCGVGFKNLFGMQK